MSVVVTRKLLSQWPQVNSSLLDGSNANKCGPRWSVSRSRSHKGVFVEVFGALYPGSLSFALRPVAVFMDISVILELPLLVV